MKRKGYAFAFLGGAIKEFVTQRSLKRLFCSGWCIQSAWSWTASSNPTRHHQVTPGAMNLSRAICRDRDNSYIPQVRGWKDVRWMSGWVCKRLGR